VLQIWWSNSVACLQFWNAIEQSLRRLTWFILAGLCFMLCFLNNKPLSRPRTAYTRWGLHAGNTTSAEMPWYTMPFGCSRSMSTRADLRPGEISDKDVGRDVAEKAFILAASFHNSQGHSRHLDYYSIFAGSGGFALESGLYFRRSS
jgi:hypothetical protein